MAQKLKFNANPTFKMTVQIPVAGQDEPGELTLTFNHLTPKAFSDAMKASIETVAKKDVSEEDQRAAMVTTVKTLAQGWAWPEEFNDENIIHIVETYPAFYRSLTTQYGEELWKVREKN